jgi:NtrC-family two-component system response regulator AlgB
MTSSLNILVVDDELSIRTALMACLEVDGHKVLSAGNARDALDLASRRSFDLAFVDLFLGSDSGIDLLPRLIAESPWMKVAVITAYASVDTAIESMKRGAVDYLPKPFTPEQVAVITDRVGERRALEQKLAGLQEALGRTTSAFELDSTSPAMQRAINLARQVASSDATVLIRGESGTGKGVLARAIHAWSPRADKPFAVVPCPSLSADLLASELFGHVKGAFTGAVRDNPGRIAASEGGTLFLDEIGDLPTALQPKLLRFVQDRQYERVGDHLTRDADVRVIAATNINLEDAVAAGRFRDDLFYRLNVIQIEVPPLRERPDDVASLAEHLLADFARQRPGSPIAFSPQATAALLAYHWPGNVRELRNVIERAMILCRSGRIGAEHLLLSPATTSATPRIGDPIPMEQVEKLHMQGVLSAAPSIEAAAKILDMDTVTLWRRRKKYGI